MKKKLLSILLIATLLIGLTGCGSSKNEVKEAYIMNNEGNEVQLSSEELMNIYDSNQAKFYKLYGGAMITFESVVESIAINTEVIVDSNHITTGQNKIVFKDGWCLIIGSENENFDLADYNAGDVLQVTTSIATTPWDTEFIKEVSGNKRVVWLIGNDKINYDEPYSNIKTTITKVE